MCDCDTLEIYFATIEGETLVFLRQNIELAEIAFNPDLVANMARMKQFPTLKDPEVLVHSTSWRYVQSSNCLVLTYLIYGHNLPVGDDQRAHRVDLAALGTMLSHDATNPNSSNIAEINVLRHALRHLSFLYRTDHVVRTLLAKDPQKAATISGIEERVAQLLPEEGR